MPPGGPELDVVIVGDGPAGLALASASMKRRMRVSVLGDDAPWTATYGMWLDDVPGLSRSCFRDVSPTVVVHGRDRHVVERSYGIVDNDALRRHFAADGADRRVGRARRVQHFTWGSRVVTAGGEAVDARYVVDASGRVDEPWTGEPDRPPAAWQTAFGVVVPHPPPRFDDDRVTFMDLRAVARGAGPPTFCYVVPVGDGWLVEETVLAARPAVAPAVLRDRLIARLGREGPAMVDSAWREESVAIPMGGRLPNRRALVVPFGAVAGYTHPATGFSVAAAMRAAPRVADALASAAADRRGRPDPRPINDAVWPTSARRTRRLHDHGLEVLLRLRPNELAVFFDAFFTLPVPVWSAYLHVDASSHDVSRVMTAVLRRLPWPVRRRLLTTRPWSRGRRVAS